MIGRRRLVARSIVGCVATAVVAGVVYAALPIKELGQLAVVLRLVLALVAFFVAVGWQVRSVVRSAHPQLRVVEALATAITLLVVLFAFIYLLLSASDPSAFSEPLDHPSSIYFTITVLATVGFGDIVPVSTGARLVVSVQMLLDLVVIGLVVRVLFVAVQKSQDRQAAAPGPR